MFLCCFNNGKQIQEDFCSLIRAEGSGVFQHNLYFSNNTTLLALLSADISGFSRKLNM